MKLKRLTGAATPAGQEFQSQWNRLVQAVEQLGKISAAPPLALDRSGGIPTLRLTENPQRLLGKLDGELEQGDSAAVSVWTGTPGSESDAQFNVTAYDWLLESGQSLTAGTKVVLERINGHWYVTGAQCS